MIYTREGMLDFYINQALDRAFYNARKEEASRLKLSFFMVDSISEEFKVSFIDKYNKEIESYKNEGKFIFDELGMQKSAILK